MFISEFVGGLGCTQFYNDGVTRGLFKMMMFTPSSELTGETLWKGCEYFSPVKNLSCLLRLTLISKWVKTVLWNQGWFQNAPETPFSIDWMTEFCEWQNFVNVNLAFTWV